MSKITEIAPQQKRGDRFSVFVDGKYSFSLSENQLMTSGLREGHELTEQEVSSWRQQSEFGKALDRAYYYLSLRPRTSKELRDYLRRKEYGSEVIELIMQKVGEQGYIDDAKFARDWVAERQAFQPKSEIVLRKELAGKGLSRELIEEAVQGLSPEDHIQAILTVIQTKRLLSRYPDEQKLLRYLANQGFRYDQIKRALEELEN